MNTFQKHQFAIAKRTLRLSDAGALILGGMTKAEARTFLYHVAKWPLARIAKHEGDGVDLFNSEGIIRDAAEERRAENKRSEAIAHAAHASNENDINRVMAQNEIESDECQTAREKAAALLASR